MNIARKEKEDKAKKKIQRAKETPVRWQAMKR